MDSIINKLPPLPLKLKEEIAKNGTLTIIDSGTEILREGQYVKVIPIVLSGLLKVFSSYADKELLLYYIEPTESCIMSFSAGLWNTPSKVFAKAEEKSEIILLPVDHVNKWVREFPILNNLFYSQYNQRYNDLLLTINQVLFDKMDKRILNYLQERSEVLGEKVLDIRHHHIAKDLGTAREVVSRVLKKLEKEHKIFQQDHLITIL